MHLTQTVSRSQAAFLLTCNKGLRGRKLYFWTFTFKEACGDAGALLAWRMFLKRWQFVEPLDFGGVRVAEVHPDGHGLHFHALVTMRCSIFIVRRIAERFGFGRIGVCRADDGAIGYLAKYLAKGGDPLQKGCRKWAAFGSIPRCRVRDVEVDSKFHRLMRAFQEVSECQQLPITVVSQLYRLNLMGKSVQRNVSQGGGAGADTPQSAIQMLNEIKDKRRQQASWRQEQLERTLLRNLERKGLPIWLAYPE